MSIRTKLQKVAWIEHVVPELERGSIGNKLVQHQVIKAVNQAAPIVLGDVPEKHPVTVTEKPIDSVVYNLEQKATPTVQNAIDDTEHEANKAVNKLEREFAIASLRKEIGI